MIPHDPDRTVLHTAVVLMCVKEGAPARVEEFRGWSAAEAVAPAWRRIRRALRSGEAIAFTTRHYEQVVQQGEARLVR